MSDGKKTGLSEDTVKKLKTVSEAVQIFAAMGLQTAFGRRVVSDLKKEFDKAGVEISEQDLMKAANEMLDSGFKMGVLARSFVRVYKDADKKPDTPTKPDTPPSPANDVEPKNDGPDVQPPQP